jgi:hypothetical protein
MSRGRTAVKIEIGLTNKSFSLSENSFKTVEGCPFILVKEEIIWGEISILGIVESVK